jgi:hypothetical protein
MEEHGGSACGTARKRENAGCDLAKRIVVGGDSRRMK